MKISTLFGRGTPVVSFEFFPPKTEEGVEQLYRTVEELRRCRPSFVSVTFGAGGSTREIRSNRKRPFKLGNTAQNEWMQAWLREKLANNPQLGKVVELFCGSGNFTQIIAESGCTAIIAYESRTRRNPGTRSQKSHQSNASGC